MKKKRLLAIFICIAVATASLAGCVQKKGTNNKSANVEDDGIYTKVGTYPILKEGNSMTFTLFAPLKGGVTTFDSSKNVFTKYFEDMTGLKFKFREAPNADAKKKLNVMMTGGDYPDAILNSGLSSSELLLYGEQGIFIPLNDLIDKYAPNIKKALDENPEIKKNFTIDGKIYSLPQIGKATHTIAPYRMFLNEEWLKNLNLKTPTTTDDFYKVLKEFKEKDANANGKTNDEIPLTGSVNAINGDPIIYLMNAFIPCSPGYNATYLYLDKNKKVVYTKTTDKWKQGLKYMHKLYSEGLMDKMTYSQTRDQLLKLGSNPEGPIVGACSGQSVTNIGNSKDVERISQYMILPPLKGPEGVRSAGRNIDYGRVSLTITKNCKSPEALIRAFDYMYTEEGTLYVSHGIPGTGKIDIAEKGVKNFIGKQAKYLRVTNGDSISDVTWNGMGPYYKRLGDELNFSAEQDGFDIERTLYLAATKDYIPVAQSVSTLIPPVAFNTEDSRTIVDIVTPINTYVAQTTIEFITGVKDIDKDWDTYIKTVNDYGLDKFVDIYQRAIDAKK